MKRILVAVSNKFSLRVVMTQNVDAGCALTSKELLPRRCVGTRRPGCVAGRGVEAVRQGVGEAAGLSGGGVWGDVGEGQAAAGGAGGRRAGRRRHRRRRRRARTRHDRREREELAGGVIGGGGVGRAGGARPAAPRQGTLGRRGRRGVLLRRPTHHTGGDGGTPTRPRRVRLRRPRPPGGRHPRALLGWGAFLPLEDVTEAPGTRRHSLRQAPIDNSLVRSASIT